MKLIIHSVPPVKSVITYVGNNCSLFLAAPREVLFWSEEFDTLDENIWQHFVTTWRGGNHEFQYYRNDRTNSDVDNGILFIQPTLTADEFGDDFIYTGSLDLWSDGCGYDMDIDGGCTL